MNIEEAIEILKEFKKTGFHTLMIKYNKDRIHTNKIIEQAIETLLTAYEKEKEKNRQSKMRIVQLEKEIEELKKPKYIINCKTNEITKLTNDFVSKDKIKAKIDEVDKDENASIPDFIEYAKEYATQKLQSLLEKE